MINKDSSRSLHVFFLADRARIRALGTLFRRRHSAQRCSPITWSCSADCRCTCGAWLRRTRRSPSLFAARRKSGTADDYGRWSVYLSPGEAGGPFQLTVKATNTITLNDILVGDVWVASGQSNMEFAMNGLVNAAGGNRGRAISQDSHLPGRSTSPQTIRWKMSSSKGWVACTPETVADSSAVAYFFARNVQQKLGVPIGLIETFWGGTAAESWTSLRSLSADACAHARVRVAGKNG